MKRVNYFFAFLNLICGILSMALFRNTYVLLFTFILFILMFIGVKKLENKSDLISISIMNIWISLFNVLYLILKLANIKDLYCLNNRVAVEYILPFFAIFIFKMVYAQKDKKIDQKS